MTWADGVLRVTTGLRGEETFVVANALRQLINGPG